MSSSPGAPMMCSMAGTSIGPVQTAGQRPVGEPPCHGMVQRDGGGNQGNQPLQQPETMAALNNGKRWMEKSWLPCYGKMLVAMLWPSMNCLPVYGQSYFVVVCLPCYGKVLLAILWL